MYDLVKSLNETSKNALANNIKTGIAYTDRKLSSKFQMKYKRNKNYKHYLIFNFKCPELFCTKHYLGETGHRIIDGTADQAGKNKQSHLLKHALTRNHQHVDVGSIKIIHSSFHNSQLKRKIYWALYNKQYRS